MTRIHFAKYRSADHRSLEEMLTLFLSGIGPLPIPLEVACLGVPGPNVAGTITPVNLPWKIEVSELPHLLGIPRVAVLNDLEATAYGLAALRQTDFSTLQAGSGSHAGNQCVIAPGTGLGEAGLFWDGTRHTPWASEYGSVSFERVVSGMGIANIYRFLRDSGHGVEKEDVAREILSGDAAAVIAHHALDGSCPLCAATMDLFVRALGAEASNMALKSMATGGVFLGGGIPPKLLPLLRRPIFLESFLNKGRFRSLLETMPLHVVLNDEAALLGSARYALGMLRSL